MLLKAKLVYFFPLLLFFILCAPHAVQAQSCAGSLGDPFVDIDFGSLISPPISTQYRPASDCPDTGQYLITGYIFGCYDKGMYSITGDHTRLISANNTGNNLMFVNAGGYPRDVIVDTVKGLCADVGYQFSAYIGSVVKPTICGAQEPISPNLTLTVETTTGTIISSVNTGDIHPGSGIVWNQYATPFTKPESSDDVVIRIHSNPAAGCGNIFLLDDIMVQPCGTKVSVTLDDTLVPGIDVCVGYSNPFVLHATFSGFNNPEMVWQSSTDNGATWQDIPGANTPTYQIPRRDSGLIVYRFAIANSADFSSLNCRLASNEVFTNVHFNLPHQAPVYTFGCLDKNFTFPYSFSVPTYVWSGPNNFTSSSATPVVPDIQLQDTGIYSVQLISDFGCVTTDTFHLNVYPSATVVVPASYTVCEGQTIQMEASGGGTYLWTPPGGLSDTTVANPTLQPLDSTRYQVLIENSYGCKDSALVNIYVYKNTVVNSGGDKYIIQGDSTILNATISGTALQYAWSPPDYMNNNLLMQPTVYPPADAEYTLNVTSAAGCGNATAVVKVHVYKDIYIPNAFTPNGDGKNDVFRVLPYADYQLEEFIVYNRWGQVMFKTSAPGAGWDGNFQQTPQPPGAYVYFVKLLSPHKELIVKKGTVLLIR